MVLQWPSKLAGHNGRLFLYKCGIKRKRLYIEQIEKRRQSVDEINKVCSVSSPHTTRRKDDKYRNQKL